VGIRPGKGSVLGDIVLGDTLENIEIVDAGAEARLEKESIAIQRLEAIFRDTILGILEHLALRDKGGNDDSGKSEAANKAWLEPGSAGEVH
jgi:hypothetical protein